MGRDKALLPLGDRTFLHHVLERLRRSFAEVILAPGDRDLVEAADVRRVDDARTGVGPIGGLVAGLRASSYPRLYLWACDMPEFRVEVARHLARWADAYDVVAPRGERAVERFGAWYARDALPALVAAMTASRLGLDAAWPALRVRLVAGPEWRHLDPDGATLRNVNTPEEYRSLLTERGF